MYMYVSNLLHVRKLPCVRKNIVGMHGNPWSSPQNLSQEGIDACIKCTHVLLIRQNATESAN